MHNRRIVRCQAKGKSAIVEVQAMSPGRFDHLPTWALMVSPNLSTLTRESTGCSSSFIGCASFRRKNVLIG
eukprot:scaffold2974_cov181-Amphora_coffeaeformis.AAC.21